MRLAVFVDQVFWRDGDRLSTDASYALFLASLSKSVERIVLIGREAPNAGQAPYALDPNLFSLCPLPYYPDLYRLWRTDPRIYGRLRRVIAEQARDWDAILISGPHPIGHMIARTCAAQGVPVIPLVRQNLMAMMEAHSGFKRVAALAVAAALEWDFRRLARGRAVLTVGSEMAEVYGRHCDRVFDHVVCLVSRAEFEAFSQVPPGTDPARLICVGRLAPEKGHADLLAALAQLRRRGLQCHLDIIGDGPTEASLRDLVECLGLAGQVRFHGYVAYGQPLFDLYGQAGILVVPSLTEGFPQVINEGLSVGLPVVATSVGGIPGFLSDGDTALLVPPQDPGALADAIERLVRDANLREGLRRRGRALMADNTLEANRGRVLEAIHHAIALRPDGRRGHGLGAPERSALEDAPERPVPALPRVSIIVPLRDEIASLDGLVADILAQDYPAIHEVCFVDGGSTDGTRQALAQLPQRDRRFAILDNPAQSTAAGLNRGLLRATGEVVMRLDAHASYGPDLVRHCVATLLRTGAAGVGPLARPVEAETLVGRAIVAAHRSPFGIGVARFRRDGAEGWATTVWNGCYWRHVVDRVGPMREDLPRAEDNDFNQRVRALGYGLYTTSVARADYRPRRTLNALGRQYFGNGLGVARILFENPSALGPHHLAPLALAGTLIATAVTGLLWPRALELTVACTALYLCGLLAATLLAARRERGLHLLVLPCTLATLHLSYGLGSLIGIGRRMVPWPRPAPTRDLRC